MLVACFFLQFLACAGGVSVEDFFPFGEAAGDLKLPSKKYAFEKALTLNGTYSFYNTGYNELQVYSDGLITLGKGTFSHAVLRHRKFPFPPNTPTVAVFYAPVQVRNSSEVFYRETRNEIVLKRATDHIRWSFVGEKDFVAISVFIATWNNVIHADSRFRNKSNTFQAVLITDGQNTFSLFNYKYDGLQWIKGFHVRYQGSRFFDAQVGFSAGDQVRSYLLPGSGTRDVKLLATKSNVLHPGQWMFKIGRPNMGALNVEAADSFFQKDFNRPLYFIVDQYFNGCFKVHGYLSSNARKIWQDVSIRSCMILCDERNHIYAALHNGSQCACLNKQEHSRLEKLPNEACDVRCVVNDEELCGGKTAASVFWAVGNSILSADERVAGLNDVDECDSGVSRCHSDASCKNKAPGYCCECNEGYFGNGIVCEQEGANLRFNGKLSGHINGITFTALSLNLIAITVDGRVYVIMRNPPLGLEHSLKILTPFADVVGWMFGVNNAKGVPNGFSVISTRFTRSVVVSFDTGEELTLKQKFMGKDASGRFTSFEATINGTMPTIRPDSRVKINSFKAVYRREDRGRVESDGTVTFEVDGKKNEFSVLQNIAYDELSGCDSSFYSFDVEARVLLSKYDEKQNYSGVAIKSSIVNASKPDTQGQQGNGNPCGPLKQTCHSKASCVNEQGREQCRCNNGYQGDGTKCEDVDECLFFLASCSSDANCINTAGSYTCKCLSGFTGDGFSCRKDSQCSQECDLDATCTEYLGSWSCVCNPGFKGNGLVCEPDGTCAGVQCSEHAQCRFAADNSRNCVCNDGYQGDGQTCAARDKCEGVTCGANATCDAAGKCACDQGFQGDGRLCEDVDECKKSLHKCHSDADCTNTLGSYSCRCKQGYLGDGLTCVKKEVSLLCNGQKCHSQAKCLDSKCTCNSGYQGDGVTCTDANECLGDNECDAFADCSNTNGSYTCTCKQGYQGNGKECTKVEPSGGCGGVKCHMYASCFEDSKTGKKTCICQLGFNGDGEDCQDLDECRLLLDPCTDNNTECVNTLGSFECLCKKGFMEFNRKCVSSDTCMGVDCHQDAECNSFRGCVCKSGYQGDGTSCEDENECDPSRSPCDLNASCTNTKGSFQCQCKSGFTGDGFRCQRVEGSCNGTECDTHAQCVQPFNDKPLQCECDVGWYGDGQTCSDVDECEPLKNLCHPLRAECINTEGSYECRCRPGYQGDGFNCTSDGSCDGVQCHDNATCFKPLPEKPGVCTCKDGWRGDGRTCYDIDECDSSKNSCDENADCINTEGSYRCQCKLGYQGDGLSCVLENSCGGVQCDSNADCLSNEGRDICLCRNGWSGDGQTCFDVDECEPFRNSCHFDAECINTEGSYECRCRPGYLGDGFNCASDGTCEGNICDQNADCNRTFPSGRRQCTCKAGWQGDGRSCSDVDECQSFKNNCNLNAECVNREGSYECRCRPGYEGDGFNCTSDGSCEGVFCDQNADCRRIFPEGVKKCKCREGWQGDGRTCSDIDECQRLKNICHSDAECINTEGSYDCRCRPGYQGNGSTCVSDGSCDGIFCDPNASCNETSLSDHRQCSCNKGFTGNGTYCYDVDECESSSTKCDLNADCFNSLGSYQCRCRLGYEGNGTYCVSDGTCDGVVCGQNSACVPRATGSRERQCVCLDGWKGDGRSCTDIDECQPLKNVCHSDAECVNTEGSYDCRCKPGYQGDGFSCVSDGSCDGIFCDPNASCNETSLSDQRQCLCNKGFTGNGTLCYDVDECDSTSTKCDLNADCFNSLGSYRCRCRLGYEGDGTYCVSDGTCDGVVCGQNSACVPRATGSRERQCVCLDGWKGDGRSCTDIDECQPLKSICHSNAECINTEGSYDCRCRPGYQGNGFTCVSDGSCDGIFCDPNASCNETSLSDQRQCLCKKGFTGNGTYCYDVDECESSSTKCDLNADCFNSLGSYRCRCRLGYEGNGTYCVSDGTCDGVVCGQNSACLPRATGSRERQCVCLDGWKGDGRICTDIDECQSVNNSCHRHADCVNTPGSFSCRCKLGYEGSGFECKSDGTCAGVLCHTNATCKNLIQGPTCVCKDGYEGSGTICTDIDECQTGANECHSNADCLNFIGSYTCQCKPGYQGDGVVCKSDGTCAGVSCHPDATCDQESLLGPECVCKPGYKGNGRKCSDVDECTIDDHKCHLEAACINTAGSYNCSCKPGFEGDGYNCKPDGTCAGIVCGLDAECVTSPSNAKVCKCKAGFTGDGLDCRDVDECTQLTHKCHRKAECINQRGSYVCRCKPGYYGSGFNCSSDGTCEGVVCGYNADCVTLNNGVDADNECRCKTGFTGNGEICSDINECEDPSVCPDKADCYNMAGSFMCHCLPGYKMVGQTCKKDCKLCLNGGSCTENNTCLCPPGFSGKRCQWHGEASLIYSKGNSIQRISLPPRPNDVGIIYQRPGAVHVGVDYDCVDQKVFWTEVTKGVIVRAKDDGSDMEVIVNSGKATSPEGIAVDWLGRNIYWTDSRLDTIQVAKLDGTERRTLISSDLRNPRAIIVDPPNGKMYWADWSRNEPKIEVANMDGSDRRVLVKSPPLKLPNGLTLVRSTNELCYCDAGVREISCVNLGDLSMRKAFGQALYPFSVTSFNRTLFWTDWRLGRIQRMGIKSKTRDTSLRSFVGSSGKIFDIKAVQPCGRTGVEVTINNVASYKNPCAVTNGGCLGLCLLKSKSYSCACPDGLHPVKNGNVTKCEEKCDSALGMGSGAITDQQLSAHSAWNNNHQRYGASRARLYLNEWPQGWSAQKNDPSPWLQIDLLETRTVTAVATQGYGNKKDKEWVKTYVLMTSLDGQRWNLYREGGRKRVFIGNVDTSSVVQNELKMPQTTRWLRIIPRSWNNHIGMRVELYGC